MMDNKFSSEEVIKVVDNMIGNIVPVGETNADNRSYENLLVAKDLIDHYMDIFALSVLPNIQRYEYSMFRSGKFVKDYLIDLEKWIAEKFED